jgi:hypothetical protein
VAVGASVAVGSGVGVSVWVGSGDELSENGTPGRLPNSQSIVLKNPKYMMPITTSTAKIRRKSQNVNLLKLIKCSYYRSPTNL